MTRADLNPGDVFWYPGIDEDQPYEQILQVINDLEEVSDVGLLHCIGFMLPGFLVELVEEA